MFGNVYVLLDDTGKNQYTKTFYEELASFNKLNNEWRWVYCSVNSFEATDEQMKQANVKTKRNIKFLSKINAVFADIDIGKKWDWQTREQKEEKKQKIIQELLQKAEPSCIIDTSNGIQPLWILEDCGIDENTQKRYVNVINGIIEWSKTVWWAGDAVKDVTRILRLPWYNHMKEEPYPITVKPYCNDLYTLEKLELIFWNYIKKEMFTRQMSFRQEREIKKTKQYEEVQRLDFKEVISTAFGAVGRKCEFDKQDRLIIDGRLTGNFIGKNGDRRYIASTSHENFAWNITTSVAEILQVSDKEAYKWILDTFNIKTETELTKKIDIPKIKYERQWYFYGNNTFEAFDCAMSGELVVVVAESNSGKTTFAMDMIQENAKRWKKCYYINLEFAIETMWQSRWLFINKKKKRNMTDIDPLSSQDKMAMDLYVQQKLAQFNYYNEPKGMEIQDIVELILEKNQEWYWLFVIDTFSRITWNLDSKIAHTNQNKTMEILQELCQNIGIVIVLLHHTNKKWEFEWSQKIMDLSNVFIMMRRDEDMQSNKTTVFTLTKDKFVTKIEIETYYDNKEYTLQKPESPF
jgi:hypothetical protein